MKSLIVILVSCLIIPCPTFPISHIAGDDEQSAIARAMERYKARHKKLMVDIDVLRRQLHNAEGRSQNLERLKAVQNRQRREHLAGWERDEKSLALVAEHLESTENVVIDGVEMTPTQIKSRYQAAKKKFDTILKKEQLYPFELRLFDRRERFAERSRQRDHLRVQMYQIEALLSEMEKKRLELRDLRNREIIDSDRNFQDSLKPITDCFARQFGELETGIKTGKRGPRQPEDVVPMVAWTNLDGWTQRINPDSIEFPSEVFRVRDGVLNINIEAADPEDMPITRLFYDEKLESYELQFLIRIADPANNDLADGDLPSLMFHCQKKHDRKLANDANAPPVCVEFQLLQSKGSTPQTVIDDGVFKNHGTSWAHANIPAADGLEKGPILRQRFSTPLWMEDLSSRQLEKENWTAVHVRVIKGVRIHVEVGDRFSGYTVDNLEFEKKKVDAGQEAETGNRPLQEGYFGLQAGAKPVEIRDVWLRKIDF